MTKKSFIENTVRTAHLVLLGSIDHVVSGEYVHHGFHAISFRSF